MRNMVDPSFINQMERKSFSKTIALLNTYKNTSIKVQIIFNKKCILVNGIEIKLPPKELAFYLWLSQQPERRINITRQFCADTKYSASYLKMYSMVSSDSRVFTSFNVDREMVEQCSAETLSKLTDIRPFEKDWLQQIRSKINGQFKKWLEAIVVEAIEIGSNEYNTQQHEVCYFMSETVIIEC